jgi:SAM-dependent methyltransferase
MQTSTPTESRSVVDATPFDDGALYDIFFEKYDLGLDFYLALAKEARGPVLDVACGTGRILLPCLKAGVDIDGLDLFPGMLSRLREKAAAAGFKPQLHQADMAAFRLPRRYAMIMICFNAFAHTLTTEDQLACLRACRDHLHRGGLLAFDTYFPGQQWMSQQSGTRELEVEIPHPETGLPVRMWDTRTFDRVAQVQHSFVEIEMLDAARKVVATYPSKTAVRWTYKAEMELLLQLAGFARWEILGGFDERRLTQETDAIVVKAWAATDSLEQAQSLV